VALKGLMAQFKEIDVHFSIDDFGTGFSSLEALSELSFSELKIDRSFVQDMVESSRNYTISSATIELANRLELDTVAEGVENEKVVSVLKGCRCKIGQGYYFSKPLPFDDYLKWLKKE
jgi:EAL domain-containing protein (putative c-di-GMP-specific phosphodiesterase class I)